MRDVICPEHSLHQLTCRCNCDPGNQVDCTAGPVAGRFLQAGSVVGSLISTVGNGGGGSNASVSGLLVNTSLTSHNRENQRVKSSSRSHQARGKYLRGFTTLDSSSRASDCVRNLARGIRLTRNQRHNSSSTLVNPTRPSVLGFSDRFTDRFSSQSSSSSTSPCTSSSTATTSASSYRNTISSTIALLSSSQDYNLATLVTPVVSSSSSSSSSTTTCTTTTNTATATAASASNSLETANSSLAALRTMPDTSTSSSTSTSMAPSAVESSSNVIGKNSSGSGSGGGGISKSSSVANSLGHLLLYNTPKDASSSWTCVVCCQHVPGTFRHEVYAIGPCDHPVCYMCSIKMRVLCEQHDCPICRQDMLKVVFTSRRDSKFSEIDWSKLKPIRNEYLIYFDCDESEALFNTLLLHSCKICKTPETMFVLLKDLDSHLRKTHELFLCDLCVDHLRILSHERKYYTRKELSRHRKTGDPDDKSHRGHPLCKFCDIRYLDDEDLHRHLRKDHYYCHFCDPMGLNLFYDEYKHLRVHFKENHFLCEEGNCKEEKFTSVFSTDIDFQAHRLAFHRTGKEAKDARVLALDFNVKPRHTPGPISGGSYMPSIGASVTLMPSRLARNASGMAPGDNVAGAVGGYDDQEEAAIAAAINASMQQELPKPEDFPTLAGEAVKQQQQQLQQSGNSGEHGNAIGSKDADNGKKGSSKAQVPGSYGSIAKEFKDFTPKSLPSNKKSTFSYRAGASSSFVRDEEDFPSLPANCAPSMQKKAYSAIKSSVTAAAGSVPKVVYKVANATCLPSSYSSAASNVASSLQVSSCRASNSSNNNKSQSTQSLISTGTTATIASSVLSASCNANGPPGKAGSSNNYSVKSTDDFPALPMAPAVNNKKSQTSSNSSKKGTASTAADVLAGSKKNKETNTITSNSNSNSNSASAIGTKSQSTVNTSSGNKKGKKQPYAGTLVGIANAAFSASTESFAKSTDGVASCVASGSKSKNSAHKTQPAATTTTTATATTTTTAATTAAATTATATTGASDPTTEGPVTNATRKSRSDSLGSTENASASHTLDSNKEASVKSKSKPSEKQQQHKPNSTLSPRSNTATKGDGSSSLSSQSSTSGCSKDAIALSSSASNLLSSSQSEMSHTSILNTNTNSNNSTGNNRSCNDSTNDHTSTNGCKSSSVKKDVTFNEATIIPQFIPPSNFEKRNLALVEQVTNLLKDQQKFSAFKRVSNDFKKDEMKGDEYYKRCIDLFGRQNLDKIFIDLITLLPNIKKQNELLSAHEKSIRAAKGAIPKNSTSASTPNILGRNGSSSASSSSNSNPQSGVWVLNASSESSCNSGILVCPRCQQVLAKKDGPEHISNHTSTSLTT